MHRLLSHAPPPLARTASPSALGRARLPLLLPPPPLLLLRLPSRHPARAVVSQVEQRFYESEGVEWTMVEYNDNKPIIDLITRKPGLFSLINDASQSKGGSTDESLLLQMHEHFGKGTAHDGVTYSQPKRPRTFMVHHYAGSVLYTIDGFIERNKDELSLTISGLLETYTAFEQLKELAKAFTKRMEMAILDRKAALDKKKTETKDGKRVRGGSPQKRQKTVSESFGESLGLLMDKLGATDHHYIRCLKPNHSLKAGDWDPPLMLRQLAYSGTLEVTKVRAIVCTARARPGA